MSTLPSSVLFLCTRNAIRSPLAEGLMKQALAEAGQSSVFVASAGLYPPTSTVSSSPCSARLASTCTGTKRGLSIP